MTEPHREWLRDHGHEHIQDMADRLEIPREICMEHSNADTGECDTFCPFYKDCLPIFEELTKVLEDFG